MDSQHVALAVAVAHQVGPGDVAPHPPRRIQAVALFPVGDRRKNHFAGDHVVPQDLLVVVDVVDKRVQGMHPLLETPLDAVPFSGGHDTRDQVEREDPVRPGRVAIDVEGDAHLEQHPLGRALVAQQLAVRQGFDGLQQKPGVRPKTAVLLEHLVVIALRIVRRKLHRPAANTLSISSCRILPSKGNQLN